MSTAEFESFRTFIYDHFGIHLTQAKRSLFLGRVRKIMRARGFSRVSEYFNFLSASKDPADLSELADKISTNHTFFYRESTHFEDLQKMVLPEIIRALPARAPKELRVWCAAASSGQEAYTLAMILKEFLGEAYGNWNTGVLGTDISLEVLQKAVKGVYPLEEIKKLPLALQKYFSRSQDRHMYQVSESIRKEVLFRRFNLLHPLPFQKPFHLVFMRNVMIYFDDKTRREIVQKIYNCLYPGGYLFIGHAESLHRLHTPFKYIKPALYQRPYEG